MAVNAKLDGLQEQQSRIVPCPSVVNRGKAQATRSRLDGSYRVNKITIEMKW